MRKFLLAIALGAVVSVGQAGVAHAESITANLTSGGIGFRTLTTTPITLSSIANSETVDGTMAALVTEGAVTGDTDWSVTAALGVLTRLSGTETIANSQTSISNRETIQVAGGGTAEDLSAASPVAMSSTVTLQHQTGQSALAVYTGTYATTADLQLSVPNGQATGVYTGTMTITLVQ
jgi:hypothetical protein